MTRRLRSPRALDARLRGAVGLLVAVGYLVGLGATTAGRGLALGAHVATEHAGPAPPAATSPLGDEHELGTPKPSAVAPEPARHGHAANLVAHRHAEPGHAEPARSGHGGHRHPASEAAPSETVGVEAEPVEAAAFDAGVTTADSSAVHKHGGRAHRHDVPDLPPGARPPVALDKFRLPERLVLLAPAAGRAAATDLADAWASVDGTVETPPPRRHG